MNERPDNLSEHLSHPGETKYEKKSYAEDKEVIFTRFREYLTGKNIEELQKEREILINRLNELKPQLNEFVEKNDKFQIVQAIDTIADLMSKLAIVTTYIDDLEKNNIISMKEKISNREETLAEKQARLIKLDYEDFSKQDMETLESGMAILVKKVNEEEEILNRKISEIGKKDVDVNQAELKQSVLGIESRMRQLSVLSSVIEQKKREE